MKKVSIQLVDDLDSKPIPDGQGRTVTFALEDKRYEIDLRDENIELLQNALRPYINVAQSISRNRVGRDTSRMTGFDDLQTVREWAANNGYEIRGRGRIPADILTAYAEAHKA